jgi:glutaredoxin-like protein NrdH
MPDLQGEAREVRKVHLTEAAADMMAAAEPTTITKEADVEYTRVKGTDKGSIKLYALSTCVWCKKTRALLDDAKIQYDYVYVDLLVGDDQKAAMGEVRKWNPSCSFPTLVLNDSTCIVGFKPEQIKAAAGF